jgi:hypothetical protein
MELATGLARAQIYGDKPDAYFPDAYFNGRRDLIDRLPTDSDRVILGRSGVGRAPPAAMRRERRAVGDMSDWSFQRSPPAMPRR